MRIRDPIGISLVGLSIVLFVIPWLPSVGLFRSGGMQVMFVMALSIFCCLSILILMIKRGRKGLWLLVGLIPVGYWTALYLYLIFYGSVLCPFLAPNPACDF
jgi:hypothetical protein